MTQRMDDDGIGENPDHDRGYAVQQIGHIADDSGERTASKLGEVHTGQETDRHAYSESHQQDSCTPDDGVRHSAARFTDGRRQLGEEAEAKAARAIPSEVSEDD